jgi:hypothetical protein
MQVFRGSENDVAESNDLFEHDKWPRFTRGEAPHTSSGAVTFAVYGTNLLDKVTFGGDTLLPSSAAFGGGPGRARPTFSPLNKGRVIGAEVRVRF